VSIGKRIRQIRKELGLNQAKFAYEIGTIQSYLSEIETDKKIPSDRLIRTIAYRWKYNFDWIKSGHGEPMDQSDVLGTTLLAESAEIISTEERRLFNIKAHLTEDEAQVLAEWLARDQEVKELLIRWAKARIRGELKGLAEADQIEFQAKASAWYLLNKIEESRKKKIPGG